VFKGTRDGLYLILNSKQDFEVLKAKLREQLKASEFFFQGSPGVILEASDDGFSLGEILEIRDILSVPYGLTLERVSNSGTRPKPRQRQAREEDRAPRHAVPRGPEKVEQVTRNAPWPLAGKARRDTLLHKGTLRSGRRIAHDGNIVIVGDVNPGAEVKATGDIVVTGSLRGLAHAGAGGDIGVVVVAFRLAPTQLRICDVIGRPPEGEVGSYEPEVARLRDGRIVLEPLEGSRWEGEV